MKDDLLYLQHINDAIVRIEQYLANKDRAVFNIDPLLQDGVIRQLEIIGEASGRLSDETQSRAAGVPWDDVIGMRHKLAHDYLGVDLDVVWKTATQDLQSFKHEIEQLIKRLDAAA